MPNPEEIVEQWERAWRAGVPPSLQQFAASNRIDLRGEDRMLVWELIYIDMEQRWRTGRQGGVIDDPLGVQPRLSDYLCQLSPTVKFGEVPSEAVVEEYMVRQLWGDRPNHDHFISRFPQYRMTLLNSLRIADDQLAADNPQSARQSKPSTALIKHPDPRSPLPWTDYRLQQLLGAGGMGKVYRARQLSLDREVAVKTLLKSKQGDAAAIERFLQEGRILARLRHRNIVGVHGLGRFPGGGYFIVMDYINGPNLEERISQTAIDFRWAAEIVIQIAQAVDFAHRQGVIHCDLKPSNVLLDGDDNVFVSDFGMAQLLQVETAVNQSETHGGTLGYMAPEQLDPQRGPLSPLTDVFGIGGILYHIAAARPPNPISANLGEDGDSMAFTTPPSPKALNRQTPLAINEICMKCLHQSAKKRYPSARELAEALRDWLVETS